MPETRTLPKLGGVHAEIRTRVRRRRRRAASVDAWSELDRAINPAFFRPALRDDVEIRDFVRRNGERYTMVKTPVGPNYVRLTAEERELLDLMDGSRTVKELVVGRFRASGDFSLSAVADLVEELYRGGFLTQGWDPVVERTLEIKRARRSHMPRWVREFRATRRIDFPGSHRFFAAMYRWGGRVFFNRYVAILCTAISLGGVVAFFILLGKGKYSLIGESAAASIGLLYLADYASTFVHESGHALACIAAGRKVNSAGFMLYLGMPAFYIETTDTWMASRKERIIAAGAGPYIESVSAGIATVLALTLPASGATLFLFRYAVLSYLAIAQNLIPFLRLDGYYLLMDAIEEMNLRERSFDFIRESLIGKIRRRERLSRQERWYAGYGILSVFFTALAVGFSLLFWSRILRDAVESAWDGGLMSRVLIVLLIAVVLAPLIRGVIRLIRTILKRIRPAVRFLRRAAERRWRSEATTMFRGLPLAEPLADEDVEQIAEHVQLVRLDPGQAVVREGERGDAFYVVRSGVLEVFRIEPGGEERTIRLLRRGRSFGEIALLEGSPRTASVRALDTSEVFRLDKGTFDRVIAAGIEVGSDIRANLISAGDLLRLAPFRTLDEADAARLLRGATWRTFKAGERIVKQGDAGESFYVISDGQVDVIEDRRKVGRLSAGDYFGEIALLSGETRTATVRAATPVRALELERSAFDRVLAKSFRKGRLAPSRAMVREWEH